jgi:hypothetical protein
VPSGVGRAWAIDNAVSAASGNVTGPLISTNNAIATWNGAGGTLLNSSPGILDGTGALSGLSTISAGDGGATNTLFWSPTIRSLALKSTVPGAVALTIQNTSTTGVVDLLLVNDVFKQFRFFLNGSALVGSGGPNVSGLTTSGTDMSLATGVPASFIRFYINSNVFNPLARVFELSATQAVVRGGRQLVWNEATDTFGIGLSAPAALAANYSLVLPAVQGAAGTVPINDGAGNLSWAIPWTALLSQANQTADTLIATIPAPPNTVVQLLNVTGTTFAYWWHWSAVQGTGTGTVRTQLFVDGVAVNNTGSYCDVFGANVGIGDGCSGVITLGGAGPHTIAVRAVFSTGGGTAPTISAATTPAYEGASVMVLRLS